MTWLNVVVHKTKQFIERGYFPSRFAATFLDTSPLVSKYHSIERQWVPISELQDEISEANFLALLASGIPGDRS